MEFIKKLFPSKLLKWLRPQYHGLVANLANVYFGRPSQRLIVIGVTGTNGKSTTVNLIARILEAAGYKVGYTSTVNYKISGTEQLNTLKMTMPSGWLLQKWMKQMADAGCQYAILEISSEGLVQNRHLGIQFDVAVFTNLTPEHIESHGGFENYKAAKGKLFEAVSEFQVSREKLKVNPALKKTVVTNADDEHAEFYASFPADVHLTYGIEKPADYRASDIEYSPQGISYKLKAITYNLQLKGLFDVYNSLAAIATAEAMGISLPVSQAALQAVPVVPGRMEVLQQRPYTVLVDYAPEPYSLRALYGTIQHWPKHRLIHILGSTGGGRDRGRREILGQMAGETADIVIVTNEDPYDDDPLEIIDEVAAGALEKGKILDQNLYKVPDRRAAIAKAVQMAREDDLLLVTGKGSEQKMAVAHGRYIDWDDRKVIQQELKKHLTINM